MALTLTVDRARWRAHLEAVRAGHAGLVPVVKGNGYGFGRTYLSELVTGWASDDVGGVDELAVGTVHELAGMAVDGPRPIVLTPALARELAVGVGPAVLTVGSERHVAEVVSAGLRPPVVVKLASPMSRYGVTSEGLAPLAAAVTRAALPIHGYAVHPPLAGTSADHRGAVLEWIPLLPAGSTVYVSHLDAPTYGGLHIEAPEHRWRIRLGTALWHGDKSFFTLTADVVEVRAARGGDRAGYRMVQVPADGHLVMATAGTAHGVAPLTGPDGGPQSPFHFQRRRLALLEAPHMHTSMLFVPVEDPCPEVGDRVDVQHPLTRTLVDRIVET
jgi:alanine racemase